MKKVIIALVLVGMIGYAIYDFVNRSGNETASDKENDVEQTDHDNTDSDDDQDESNQPSIGLEKGDKAPDFELNTLDGKKKSLSDYQGKKVMLNFWASWCGPCRIEMPDVEKLYKNEDIEIVSVNLTQTEENMNKIKDFVDEYNMTFPVFLDEDGSVSSLYGIQPIPTSYMIDTEGIIQNQAYGALKYDMMVDGVKQMD